MSEVKPKYNMLYPKSCPTICIRGSMMLTLNKYSWKFMINGVDLTFYSCSFLMDRHEPNAGGFSVALFRTTGNVWEKSTHMANGMLTLFLH